MVSRPGQRRGLCECTGTTAATAPPTHTDGVGCAAARQASGRAPMSINAKSSMRVSGDNPAATKTLTDLNSKSIMFGSRKTKASTRSGKQHAADPTRIIINGVDCTPRPLVDVPKAKKSKSKSKKTSGQDRTSTGSSISSLARSSSVAGSNLTREGGSVLGPLDGSASFVGSDVSESLDGTQATSSEADASEFGAARSDVDGADSEHNVPSEPTEEDLTVQAAVQETPKHDWTSQELNELIEVRLTESGTTTLLNLPSLCIWSKQADLAAQAEAENARYAQRVTSRMTSSERAAQTFNPPMKTKEVQAKPPAKFSVSCQSSRWDIYDSRAEDSNDADPKPTGRRSVSHTKLLRSLSIMEKALIQNQIHGKHLLYRNQQQAPAATPAAPAAPMTRPSLDRTASVVAALQKSAPVVETNADAGEAPAGTLDRLWSYSCAHVLGHNITSMDWNKANADVLAVGYGQADFSTTSTASVKLYDDSPGMIAVWTLKNPDYPSRIFRSQVGVTSLDFSQDNPQLLAAGLYDGSLVIYDVRAPGNAPILKAASGTHSHSDPVWGVKWASKGAQQHSEVVMSISTDGHVKQWSMKKGLYAQDIMVLKRVHNQSQMTTETGEGMINRHGSSLCFDFSKVDPTLYLAGTEDGVVHKCSQSYNEQVIESYFGHTGPINRLKVSPFVDGVFLTCSTDWTVRLWSQKSTQSIMSLQSGYDYINDVDWSPSNSCVFASASRDGRLDVWNIEASPISPWITETMEDDTNLTTVLFSPNAPVVVCGTQTGIVHVYRLGGLTDGGPPAQQQTRLNKIISADN
ncbi:unnamed protein product (mitochondrion) [Plasmodiophora brassicae]|uniref:Dynein axonemal intermediate chain 4 n=1 Tax=Plasmodiophora brassicae TaxID=37360 RepID=A0A3P3YMC2_PLABS|nr:unnamed protein product [Plasmodiophora brassicae]